MSPDLRQGVLDGGYWLRRPGANCELVIAYQGVVAPEALAAAGYLGEDRRDIGLLAVTSADRLNAGWQGARSARARGERGATSHVEKLLSEVPRNAALVTVHDAHPATLTWLGGVKGHRVASLGVEHFGQTGSIKDLYRHFEIDTDAILRAAEEVTKGRPIRYARAAE